MNRSFIVSWYFEVLLVTAEHPDLIIKNKTFYLEP